MSDHIFKIDRILFIDRLFTTEDTIRALVTHVKNQLRTYNTAYVGINDLFGDMVEITSDLLLNPTPNDLKSEINADGTYSVDELEFTNREFIDTTIIDEPDFFDFMVKYKPILQTEIPNSADPFYYDYMIDTHKFDPKLYEPNRVFTAVRVDGGLYVVPGYQFVNREGYFVTVDPYVDPEEQYTINKSIIELTRGEAIDKCVEHRLKALDPDSIRRLIEYGFTGYERETNQELEYELFTYTDQEHCIV